MTHERMKYDRVKFNGNALTGLFLENYEMYMLPNLPTIELKVNKTKYEVTDLRCLNEKAIHCLMEILDEVCSNPNCKEVPFDMTGLEEDEIHMISDILSGMTYKAYTSRGKGYTMKGEGHFLVNSMWYQGNNNIYTFGLNQDNAKIIYEYAKGKESVSYYELVIAVAENFFNQGKKILSVQ